MRMDYDLAESLMDAGFPQIGKGSLIGPLNKLVWRTGDRVYAPTLEELIEACGENFAWLHQSVKSRKWAAQAFIYDEDSHGGQGSTPTEAVARLWLALNKKI